MSYCNNIAFLEENGYKRQTNSKFDPTFISVPEMPCTSLILETRQRKLDPSQKPVWDPEETSYESYEHYREGGYCPIILHQELKDGRYSVEYKLGHGCSATVWLARDNHDPGKHHVALKVLTANQSAASLEPALLRKIASHNTKAASASVEVSYVINLLDEFDVTSANGNHRILVMPVTRSMMSLADSKVPLRSVVKSLVKGLDAIHSAGIVHGGRINLTLRVMLLTPLADIHTGNIGYRFDLEYVSDILPPECIPLPPVGKHRPHYLVSSDAWQDRPETSSRKRITGYYMPMILDFGNGTQNLGYLRSYSCY